MGKVVRRNITSTKDSPHKDYCQQRVSYRERPTHIVRRNGHPYHHPIAANLIIVGVALLLMFGPVRLEPSLQTDAYIVVAVLMLGAAVNAGLVRLALRPLKSIERVATWVSQGRLGERVPTSIVADRELARLSRTINAMLDSLAADRKRIEKLSAE